MARNGHIHDLQKSGRRVSAHRPWPRIVVDGAGWSRLGDALVEGQLDLVGLWGEAGRVHVAVREPAGGELAVLTLPCENGRFASLGARHAPAIRLERAAHDLFGLVPQGLKDRRSWLDHGKWGLRAPHGAVRKSRQAQAPYPFLKSEGESLHQIPVGPVHAGIIEPGHFRFTANGETVVRLEERLGYTHKGIEKLMAGADVSHAARLAGRISGDSTVAYGLAFARACEAATGAEVPVRAVWLRALMAELERLANHLGDIGAICNDAAFALMLAHCGALRERVLRAASACFGHRLMRECVRPGGVARDLDADGEECLRQLIGQIRERFPRLVFLYDNTASLLNRTVGAGAVSCELVAMYAAGGFVGRASGRQFDARKSPGYAPYGELEFTVPVRKEGDVDARVWVRIDEVNESLSLIEQILDRLPEGVIEKDIPRKAGEGMALVEGFRGDILVWVSLDGAGRVVRCHPRDPSWFQWPLLEAAIENNIVADFPLCNKSFNCSYSGHDL